MTSAARTLSRAIRLSISAVRSGSRLDPEIFGRPEFLDEPAARAAAVLVHDRERDVLDVEVQGEPEHDEEEGGHDDHEDERPGVPADLAELLAHDRADEGYGESRSRRRLPFPAAAVCSSILWMKTSSSEGTIRSMRSGAIPARARRSG